MMVKISTSGLNPLLPAKISSKNSWIKYKLLHSGRYSMIWVYLYVMYRLLPSSLHKVLDKCLLLGMVIIITINYIHIMLKVSKVTAKAFRTGKDLSLSSLIIHYLTLLSWRKVGIHVSLAYWQLWQLSMTKAIIILAQFPKALGIMQLSKILQHI